MDLLAQILADGHTQIYLIIYHTATMSQTGFFSDGVENFLKKGD